MSPQHPFADRVALVTNVAIVFVDRDTAGAARPRQHEPP